MLIRQRWRRTAAVLAFLAFCGALGTTAAQADDAPESATEPTQAALLATPAELAELGFGAADIARQEAAVERLTSQESAAQARLRRAEARYSAGPAQHWITTPGRPALRLGAGVTPWRGPTQTEYYFDELYGSIRVYKIQISSGPTS